MYSIAIFVQTTMPDKCVFSQPKKGAKMMKPDLRNAFSIRQLTKNPAPEIGKGHPASVTKKSRPIVLVLAALLLTSATSAYANFSYSIVDLGSLGGGYTMPTSINDAGQVAGYGRLSNGNTNAFFYNHGSMTAIGTLGGANSYASDINARGQVVGYSLRADGSSNAFVYSNSTGAIGLGTLGGTNSWASGINDAGQIVGRSQIAGDASSRAFIYQGSMSTVGTLDNAIGINNAGQVLGFENWNPVLYSGGSSSALGVPTGGCCFAPAAINDKGQIAGTAMPNILISDVPHAFYYDGAFTDLGTLNGPGGSDSRGLGINNAGQVVGWSNFHEYDDAFLYSDGSMINLSLLPDVAASGWRLRQATAINSKGQIVGWGSLNGEANHGFLLSPLDLPEPSNIALMLGGLGLLAVAVRRQNA
jgi:probable HAF family extracellular repeat protein